MEGSLRGGKTKKKGWRFWTPFASTSLLVCGVACGHRVGILAQDVQRRRFFRRKLRLHLLRLLLRNLREELDIAVALETRSGGNQPAHDHVFLQAAQIIDLPGNCRFGKDAGRLLEARRGNKRIRGERGLGDAEEQRTARRRTPAIVNDPIVFFAEAELVHLLFQKESRA